MSDFCISCFKPIGKDDTRQLLEKDVFLCNDCISQIRTELAWAFVDKCPILFLGEYDGLMKTWLMNYKEFGDVELARCFLFVYLPLLRLLFPHYVFVPCPSSEKRYRERGFAHLEEMLKASSLPYCLALKKGSGCQQKQLSLSNRYDDKKDIQLTSEASQIKSKKVVLFDDVMTTGNTFRASLRELRKANPKCIRGVILMRTRRTNNNL